MRTTFRLLHLLLAAAVFAGLGPQAVAAAQERVNQPVDLPDGPSKPGFDIHRFSGAGNGWFETFYVKDTQTLRKALQEGKVGADTRILVTQTAGGKLALLADQMSFHHIAQGHAGGKDWLATL